MQLIILAKQGTHLSEWFTGTAFTNSKDLTLSGGFTDYTTNSFSKSNSNRDCLRKGLTPDEGLCDLFL